MNETRVCPLCKKELMPSVGTVEGKDDLQAFWLCTHHYESIAYTPTKDPAELLRQAKKFREYLNLNVPLLKQTLTEFAEQ